MFNPYRKMNPLPHHMIIAYFYSSRRTPHSQNNLVIFLITSPINQISNCFWIIPLLLPPNSNFLPVSIFHSHSHSTSFHPTTLSSPSFITIASIIISNINSYHTLRSWTQNFQATPYSLPSHTFLFCPILYPFFYRFISFTLLRASSSPSF